MGENALHAGVFVDRAVIAYSDGRYEESLKELQQALKLDPENIDALYYQGLAYAALNRNAEAYVSLERAKKLRPSDIDVTFQLGVLHFGDKQYDRAEPYLREVYRANPKHPNIGYYLGVIEFNKQNYREALSYFKGDVPSDPDFEQLNRFYTALTLTRLGATAEAKAEVDLAVRAQPSSPLTAPAQRLGEILSGAQREEKRFGGQLRLGYIYDSNAPVVPVSGGSAEAQAFRRANSPANSWGSLIALDLDYKWLKTAAWEASVSHHFFQTLYYNSKVRDFNTQENMPTLSIVNNGVLPAFLGSMAYSAGMQTAYDYISLGNAPFVQRGIFSPYMTLIENSWNATTLLFRFQGKDFFHNERAAAVDNQDALNNTVGWLHFFFFEKSRHYIKIGYQYDDENARGKNWDYQGHRLLAGFQYTFPWDVRFRYDLDYHWRLYDHHNTLHPDNTKPFVRRRDNEPIHLVGFAKDFNLYVPLTAGVEYFYDRGHSNIDLYNFSRHVVTMSLAWHF